MQKHTPASFLKILNEDLGFTATSKQDIALQLLSDFVVTPSKDRLFLLKGYAGTGKTTIISTLVKNLWKVKKNRVCCWRLLDVRRK